MVDEQGADALTLRAIAREVGVDHTAAYRHFEDKQAVLAACAAEEFDALARRLRASIRRVAPRRPTARLDRIGRAFVAFALARPPRFRLMFGRRLNQSGNFPSLEAAVRRAFAIVTDEARRAAVDGAAARDIGLGILTMAHGYVDMVLARRIHVRSPRVAVRYFSTLLRPLLAGLDEIPPRGTSGRRTSH